LENEIQILENLIRQNSNDDCCSNNIRFAISGDATKGLPFVKLYGNICFACKEKGNSAFYPLERIIRLNTNKNLNCHNCKDKCGIDGCVISLRVYDTGNSAFTKVNRIEIIFK
jgi:hypothetical protein